MNASNESKNGVLLLIAIGSIAAPAAHSQAVDTSEWVCEFCPFESGHRAEYSLGASTVSDDSAYFGDASGYSEEGVYANVDGHGTYVNDDHRLQWQIEDLGLDSRFARLRGGRQGTFDYDVAYRQLPRHQYFTTDTIFQQSANGTLTVPPGWIRAPLTSGFTELDASLVPRDIESERRTLDLGGNYLASGHFKFSANYRRQERDGLNIYGGSYFTQSSLLPGAFDYVTDVVDFGIRYAGDQGSLLFAYYVSDFDNKNTELRWENPFTSAPGAEFAAMARAPDNTFQQVSLSGSYGFAQNKTIVSFSAAIGRLEQDQAFLPYTTNTNLTVDPLPQSSLDAEINTTNLAFTLSSRAFSKSHIKLAYRYDERDNQTQQYEWNRVITDTFVSGTTETNTPYSFERSALNLSADYDLFDNVIIAGGYDRKTIDRDFQEVAEQTEDTGWGRLRWRPNGLFEVSIKGGVSERDVDRYNETFAATLGQNPLMRKYNLAYRYRRFGEVTFSASLPETPVSLTVNGTYSDDDYTQSLLGVTAGDDTRLAADLSWAVSETSSLYLTGGYENIESQQSGSELFAAPDWSAHNTDSFYTSGAGFRVRQIGGKFDLQMDYTRSDGTSEIIMTSASGGLSQFPDLESTLDYLRFKLSYQRSDRLELTMNIRYQSFSAEDWALDGVDPATIPVVLTLGADPYDDDVWLFGLGLRYSFGTAGKTATE